MLNKRQQRCLSALRTVGPGCELAQPWRENAAWAVWHPEHWHVRLKLTCRDVMGLVSEGFVTTEQDNNKRFFIKEKRKDED